MTNEELAEAVARIAELDAKRSSPGEWVFNGDDSGGFVSNDKYIVCDDQTHYATAVDVDDQRFIAAATLMAKIIAQLWAEREQTRKAGE